MPPSSVVCTDCWNALIYYQFFSETRNIINHTISTNRIIILKLIVNTNVLLFGDIEL